MTSATEVLRRLLDERGVEYTQTIVTEGVLFTVLTSNEHYFILVRDNNAGIEMWSQYLTPEQAIAATLGSCNCTNDCTNSERTETCHIEAHFGEWYCTVCGDMVGTCDPDSELCVDGNYVSMWNYCPNCGRRIEQ